MSKTVSVILSDEDLAALAAAARPNETTSDTLRRLIYEGRVPRTIALEVRGKGLPGWARQGCMSPAEAASRAPVYRARGLEVRLVDVEHRDPRDPGVLGCAEQVARLNAEAELRNAALAATGA